MARPLKDIVNIGDTFENWTIYAKEVNDKKYNYNFLCRCNCGAVRTIKKHDLVNQNLPTCQECKNHVIINMKYDLISTKWHKTLNRKELPHQDLLDVKSNYWFKCEEGHAYLTTIQGLSTDCPVCVENALRIKKLEKLTKAYDKLVDYSSELLEILFPKATIETLDSYFVLRLTIPEKDAQVLIYPKFHMKHNRLIHKDKNEYLRILSDINQIREDMNNNSYNTAILEIELDFAKDASKLNKLIRLIYKGQGESI